LFFKIEYSFSVKKVMLEKLIEYFRGNRQEIENERQEYDNSYVGRITKLEGGSRRYASAVRPVSD
jgi:hypothetical protein